ncbi:DNA-3-methyladenine glycosylase 2 family protein [Luminiphilus sp.]|nr:DNA-3-methyladenine glycosylase 2 family protein [Luminiphilus sp.]MDC1117089.1 DNA-3-methyladenine glycosylase 2 family protein [Luminiphilus sp.]
MTVRFALTESGIRRALDALSQDHAPIEAALNQVGYPASRRRDHSFASLARIIIGQQLSTKAAATITTRVEAAVGAELTPSSVLSLSPEALRAAGLSRQKIGYLQALSEAVASNALPLEQLPRLGDDEVESAITGVRGLGRWSAHMYMMFALGRPDVWPSGDLAVRVGFGRIMAWSERPDEKKVIAHGAVFSPHRSALALLCWHFYSEAPL